MLGTVIEAAAYIVIFTVLLLGTWYFPFKEE